MGEAGAAVARFFLFAVLAAAGVYILMSGYLFFFQARFVYHPYKEMIAAPSDMGFDYREVIYETGDGVPICAWYTPVPDAAGVVLFCHGNAGNISHRMDTIRIYRELGFSVFIFDYRGYGKSGGKPGEQGTYLDVRGAWDYLTKTLQVPPGNIILAGRSLGGAVASYLAAREKPRALVVESSFTSIPDVGAELYPYLPVRLLSRFQYNTREYVEAVSCPVLVIHSPDDEMIPFKHGERIFEAASSPKQFFRLQGSHNEGFKLFKERYVQGLKEFLATCKPTSGEN